MRIELCGLKSVILFSYNNNYNHMTCYLQDFLSIVKIIVRIYNNINSENDGES